MAPLMKKLNLMTFNCKSIQSTDRLLALQTELTKLKKFDVLGLAETWQPGQTCCRLSTGEFLYNSGKTGDSRFTGTGLLLSAEMNRQVIGVKYVSDRIIQVLLKMRAGKTLRITQVYAPQSGRGEDEYDAFLDLLSSSLARPLTYDIVLGDFNASTGPRENGERFI
uniref:Endonuclease/exonuclease/phosphatase domain-containing protein n=1 Tax=Panagrolaimus sp. ES5 TaxID=591445 RepID=A0AC34GJU7_9BILA